MLLVRLSDGVGHRRFFTSPKGMSCGVRSSQDALTSGGTRTFLWTGISVIAAGSQRLVPPRLVTGTRLLGPWFFVCPVLLVGRVV